MAGPLPTIALIDDDVSVRESLPDLLRELGFSVYAFASAQEFLESDVIEMIRCLIADVGMSPMSGLDLHAELRRRGHRVPIIFVSGHLDDDLRRLVLDGQRGQFLFKPFGELELQAAISAAMGGSAAGARTGRNGDKA